VTGTRRAYITELLIVPGSLGPMAQVHGGFPVEIVEAGIAALAAWRKLQLGLR